jgi:hypothetical protein
MADNAMPVTIPYCGIWKLFSQDTGVAATWRFDVGRFGGVDEIIRSFQSQLRGRVYMPK